MGGFAVKMTDSNTLTLDMDILMKDDTMEKFADIR